MLATHIGAKTLTDLALHLNHMDHTVRRKLVEPFSIAELTKVDATPLLFVGTQYGHSQTSC